jgi:hypothetical protein
MWLKKTNVALLMCLIVHLVNGQDIHFSYYQFNPLNVNPAFAGAFYGSYRISGIYSDKFFTVTDNQYQTLALSVDAPIIRGLRAQDWVGVGFEIDGILGLGRAGTFHQPNPDDMGNFPVGRGAFQNWAMTKINAAYHFSLDKKQTNILTFGGQYAIVSRTFNELSAGDTRYGILNGTDPDVSRFNMLRSGGGGGGTNVQDRISLPLKDWTFGFMYNARRKDSDLKLGFAMEGIFKPQIRSTSERKQRGLNIHGSYDMKVSKKVAVVPGFYYYSIGDYSAFNYNGHVKYTMDEEKGIILDGGLGFRNLRQAILMVGAEYKDYRFGLAYDLDISDLSPQSGAVGGFEIGVQYMGKIYKKPKPKPVIFCPTL